MLLPLNILPESKITIVRNLQNVSISTFRWSGCFHQQDNTIGHGYQLISISIPTIYQDIDLQYHAIPIKTLSLDLAIQYQCQPISRTLIDNTNTNSVSGLAYTIPIPTHFQDIDRQYQYQLYLRTWLYNTNTNPFPGH